MLREYEVTEQEKIFAKESNETFPFSDPSDVVQPPGLGVQGTWGHCFVKGAQATLNTLLDNLMASLEELNEGPDKSSVFELCGRFKWPWEKHVLKPCCRLHTLDGEVKHWGNSTPQWFLCLASAPRSDSPGSANRLAILQQVIREMSREHCAKKLLFSSAP